MFCVGAVTESLGLHLFKKMNVMRVPLLLLFALSMPAVAMRQQRLTLDDAVARARIRNPSARAAGAAEREAVAGVDQARASFLPRVDVLESWQRSNLPVFAFSSLLAQRRFSDRDFEVATLNHPEWIDNFRTAIAVEQPIFDGATRAHVRTAELGRDAAALRRRQVAQDLATATVDAYGRVLLFEALADAARAAVAAADQDARRARDRQEVGTATQADVLSIDVHAAAMREREIQTRAEAGVARARLNDLMGAPLDTAFELDTVPAAAGPVPSTAALEAEALGARPDILLTAVEQRTAEEALVAARAVFFPQAAFRGGWELNGGTFGTGAPGWLVGVDVRLNLFHGFADRARVKGAEAAIERRAADRARVQDAARLEVRAALARLAAVEARRKVAAAIVAQAEESQRIAGDRYEQGLEDVTTLLHTAQAVLDAKAQDIASRVDLLVQRAALDRAVGR